MNWHRQRAEWLHSLDREIKAAEAARARYLVGKQDAIHAQERALVGPVSLYPAGPSDYPPALRTKLGQAAILGRVSWHNSDAAKALESEERWALDRAKTYAAAVSALSDAYRRPSSAPA